MMDAWYRLTSYQEGADTDVIAAKAGIHFTVYCRWDGTSRDLSESPNDKWIPYPLNVCIQIASAPEDGIVDVGRGYVVNKGAGMQLCSTDPSKVRWARGFVVSWQWNASNEVRKPEYQPFSLENQLILEQAWMDGVEEVEITVGNSVESGKLMKYRIHLWRTPMIQECCTVEGTASSRRRFVRRIGAPKFSEKESAAALSVPRFWNDLMNPNGLNPGATACVPFPLDHPLVLKVQSVMNSTIKTGHKPVGLTWAKSMGDHKPPTSFQVTGLYLVRNKGMWKQYSITRDRLRTKYLKAPVGPHPALDGYTTLTDLQVPSDPLDPSVNEAYFFHGTGWQNDTLDLIDVIVKGGVLDGTEDFAPESQVHEVQGMNERFCSDQGMFGGGVYLADLSSKANLYVPCPVCYHGSYKGSKTDIPCQCSVEPTTVRPYRMLMCRALLGNPCVVTTYTPEQEKGFKVRNPLLTMPGMEMYDSVVAGPIPKKLMFREYIVYDGAQVYPEFIIEYKRVSS